MILKVRKFFISVVMLLALGFFPLNVFANTTADASNENQAYFVIAIDEEEVDVVNSLYEKKLIKNKEIFNLILDIAGLHNKLKPGGYKIDNNLNELQVVKILISESDLKWIVIPEGYRKEQIAEVLAKELRWKEKQKMDWIFKTTETKPEYAEGVYFPDTYLIKANETGEQIAKRMINRFNEKFAPYQAQFLENDIKWTTALKIASIVQREAASKEDMPLIAGIIWNRLADDMRLEIDASVQYVKDSLTHSNVEVCQKKNTILWSNNLCMQSGVIEAPFLYISSGDWWKPIASEDKKINSSYNLYLNTGLPPKPIANPGLSAIDSVLNPAVTDCLFYLHDKNKKIHCAKTYDEHLKNIETYLK
ncbi:endolytic transglycosylase MltG [bacterium]|nr:endolytic transglycosylase MltG [bacterium]